MFYKDWQRISSASRCVIRQEGPDLHTLVINGLLTRDSGTYQIVAENEAGRVHCNFSLLVEGELLPTQTIMHQCIIWTNIIILSL